MDDENNQQQSMPEAIEQDTIGQLSEEPEDSGAIAGEMASTTTDEDNMDEAIDDDMSNGTSDNAGNVNESDEIQEVIGHESNSTSEERITIDDINMVSQMNSSQMAIDEE